MTIRRRRSRPHDDAPLEEKLFGSHGSGRARTAHRADTRARQLCRQAQEQLELVLGELDDPLFAALSIHGVAAQGRGSMLRVQVVIADDHDPQLVRIRLESVRGRLRSEIAAAIHRKRTPQLAFTLIPASALRLFDEDDDAQ